MTHQKALKMRAAIAAIFSFSKDNRYDVAIQPNNPFFHDGEWEVHIFVREGGKSGLMNCALLANAIETISYEMLSMESEYDISTNDVPKLRPSFKIW